MSSRRIRCEFCDKPVRLRNLEYNHEYRCPQCENIIYRPGASRFVVSSLAFSTLVLLIWALFSPLLNVYILGEIKLSVYDTIKYYLQTDIYSGVFLSLTILVVPVFMNLLTLLISYSKELKLPFSLLKKMISIYLFIKEWNMIEVYFVGLLISMVKLYELADVILLAGFWINLVYVLLLYINLMIFNPLDYANIKTRKPVNKNMVFYVFLFLILSLIFIPPSNLLPIMPTYKYSVAYDNTILDGIIAFWEDGDIIVPIIIFFASICIPVLKIVGLFTMLIMAKFKVLLSYRKFATKYYIVTDKLGKYSLLDVYVVVFASAYIQFDDLVRIGIGVAVIPFSLVVIFTMVASKLFDTRTLWKEK